MIRNRVCFGRPDSLRSPEPQIQRQHPASSSSWVAGAGKAQGWRRAGACSTAVSVTAGRWRRSGRCPLEAGLQTSFVPRGAREKPLGAARSLGSVRVGKAVVQGCRPCHVPPAQGHLWFLGSREGSLGSARCPSVLCVLLTTPRTPDPGPCLTPLTPAWPVHVLVNGPCPSSFPTWQPQWPQVWVRGFPGSQRPLGFGASSDHNEGSGLSPCFVSEPSLELLGRGPHLCPVGLAACSVLGT